LRQKIVRGRIDIEAAIDLHGMDQEEAHHALSSFIRRAHGRAQKLVLVVTGKGKTALSDPSSLARESGILRRLVPHWLRAFELRGMVLGFEEAAQIHGGAGALYVRLRRRGRGSSREVG
jgi:DNA-nicking Smr family endonuclease